MENKLRTRAKELADQVVCNLVSHGWTVTSSESCTGGLISAELVGVAGASNVFSQGLITYSNQSKESLLGVRHETLELFGAVSPQTAREMAFGSRVCYQSDFGLSSTGIAGPDGGSESKPVGTVYLSCSYAGNTLVRHYAFSGDRNTVRDKATAAALELLLDCIREKEKEDQLCE